jgi:hypothetical protein
MRVDLGILRTDDIRDGSDGVSGLRSRLANDLNYVVAIAGHRCVAKGRQFSREPRILGGGDESSIDRVQENCL